MRSQQPSSPALTLSPARRRPAVALALCAAALAIPVIACAQVGDDDDDEPTAPASAPASTPAQPALTLSADGTLVLDIRARLAWPRCVEGMRWNGSDCIGAPDLLSYNEAQALARKRWKAEDVRWRLPRVNELRRLLNRSTPAPAVDARLFPSSPPEWHWTGTASINVHAVNPYAYDNVTRGGSGENTLYPQQGWAVDMTSGQARGDMGRHTRLAVRLVRPAP
ncbi:DUF1566 domain-containing protein [Diaphorobacter sp.]|uniref:Lcl C-terminal domain-containing protein n=1 Tax=Diaphorobacter sp. TaxID=1934310 RepID=UPI003D0B147D